jgi:hypothetical protein
VKDIPMRGFVGMNDGAGGDTLAHDLGAIGYLCRCFRAQMGARFAVRERQGLSRVHSRWPNGHIQIQSARAPDNRCITAP